MKNNFIVLTIIIVLASTQIQGSEICQKFTCGGALGKGQCAQKTDNFGVIEYSLQSCTNPSNDFCPLFNGSGETTFSCSLDSTKLPSYPGGPCQSNTDCISGSTCTANKCTLSDGVLCDQGRHDQCYIGSACLKDSQGKYSCGKQKKITEACNSDYDCVNNAACISNVCIGLFSLLDGASATPVFTSLNNDYISVCQNAFIVNGKCSSLKLPDNLKETPCTSDDQCSYSTSTQTTYNSRVGACDCGYNKLGNKYCKPGSVLKDTVFQDYINNILTNLNNLNCHTMERFKCKAVIEDSTNYKAYQTKEFQAVYSYKIIQADSCVQEVIYPFMNTYTKKCPAFACNATTTGTCAVATGSLYDGRTVNLQNCSDTTKPICSYKPDQFLIEVEYDAYCTPPASSSNLALPGESCQTDDDCKLVIVFGTTTIKYCDKTINKCKGSQTGVSCASNESCTAGNFCDMSSGSAETYVCANQKDLGASCSSSYSCANNMICNGTCFAAFSQDLGFNLQNIEADFLNYSCSSGYQYQGKCAKLKYSNTYTPQQGLVTCNFNSQCNYIAIFDEAGTNTTAVADTCQCGYNANGQGYCPFSRHDDDTIKLFNNLKTAQQANLNNKLHTNHRFSGNNSSAKASTMCYEYYQNSAYRNAVACAKDVLGKGSCSDNIDPDVNPSSSSSSTTSQASINKIYNVIIALLMTVMLI